MADESPHLELAERLKQAAALARSDPARIEQEARAALAELAARGTAAPLALKARARVALGRALMFRSRAEEALREFVEAEGLLQELDDLPELIGVKLLIGQHFMMLGHEDAALELFGDAERLLGAAPADVDRVDQVSLADARRRLVTARASVLRRLGKPAEALALQEPLIEELRPLSGESSDPELYVVLLQNTASALWQVDRCQDARQILAEATEVCQRHGLAGFGGWHEALSAWIEAAAGQRDRALEHARRGLTAEGDRHAVASAKRAFSRAALLEPQDPALLSEAAEVLQALVEEGQREGWWDQLPTLYRELADVQEARDELQLALEALRAGSLRDQELRRQRLAARRVVERLQVRRERQRLELEGLHEENRLLAELNHRLQELAEERTRLLATAAHDLRTPLTAIRCCVELLRLAPPDSGQILAQIDRCVVSLNELVSNVLDTDAVRQGRVQLEQEDLALSELLADVVERLSPLARQKAQSLAVDCASSLRWRSDRMVLGRVTENLLSNALKFSPAASEVRVAAEVAGGRLALSVADQGPGFKPGEAERAFAWGETSSARPTGDELSSGFGLAIVRDLVQALGGQVAVEAPPLGGARVVVTLPG